MTPQDGPRYYMGVDVGTGSARAGVFDAAGTMHGTASRDLCIWRPEADFVEQSTEDIWSAVCGAAHEALEQSGARAKDIAGVGFDATCSLAVLDDDDQPVSVSPAGQADRNVIVWMDHRAIEQAARVNATGHDVLRYVGGGMSPEMQPPKLLWLLEHMPETWRRAARFFDLPDFLSYRATGDDTRSLCTTVCKWGYLGHEPAAAENTVGRWDETFFRAIGLACLADEGFRRIGTRVRPMGEPVGRGLTERAAGELGLAPGTPVGVSIIDAHAGGLGVLGASLDEGHTAAGAWDARLALIGGTSSCHMAVSKDPRFISGVWGPYFSAMIPSLWLTEGGQSATGALIDHVIFSHARGREAAAAAEADGKTVYELLNDRLEALSGDRTVPATLTHELHVLPYFHGNRSPRADASLKGMVSGLTLGDSLDDLALLYLATVQAVAHGTRHIVDTLNAAGYRIDTIHACGGGTKNPVFLRAHADVTGCRIVLPREPEAVLLGAAVLGGVASGDFDSVPSAMAAMNRAGPTLEPESGQTAAYHNAKHAVFRRMYEDQIAYRNLMAPALGSDTR